MTVHEHPPAWSLHAPVALQTFDPRPHYRRRPCGIHRLIPTQH